VARVRGGARPGRLLRRYGAALPPVLDRGHFWDFTKNFGLVGGLLLVALGTGIA
jgi:hypothetical protein